MHTTHFEFNIHVDLEEKTGLTLFVMGGISSGGRCFTYSLDSNKMEELPKMSVERSRAVTFVVSDRLYVAGGSPNEIEDKEAPVEMLDLKSKSGWIAVADMKEKRWGAMVIVLADIVYICGGTNDVSLSSCEKFDGATNQWFPVSNMLYARERHGAAVLAGSVFCVGGFNEADAFLRSAERYCPETDTWKEIAAMNTARSDLVLQTLAGHLYAIGGESFIEENCIVAVEKCSPATDQWTVIRQLNICRSEHAAAVSNGQIYVFGGIGDGSQLLTSIEAYNPDEDKWEVCHELRYTAQWAALLAI